MDVNRLYKDFSIMTKSVVDLRNIYIFSPNPCDCVNICNCLSKRDKELKQRYQLGLRSLAQIYLNISMDKSHDIRCSDWASLNLSEQQIEYAAWDACIATHIFEKIISSYDSVSSYDKCNSYREYFFTYLLKRCILNIDYNLSTIDEIFSATNSSKPNSNDQSVKKVEKDENMKVNHSSKGDISHHKVAQPIKVKKRHKVEARKSLLYDNCKMLAPDGLRVLSTCSRKKLMWYVDR
jgi:3'-5' exonuclease